MDSDSVSSNVDGRLKAISGDLDLTEALPIHQKRLVTFFNHFIITMVDFLNNFSNSCSHRLYMFDRKISKIEAELRLLEIKLNSLPGFEDEPPKTKMAVDAEIEVKPLQHENVETQKQDAVEIEAAEETVVEAQEPIVEEVDPIVKKYIKMVQFGVPVLAVKQKMQSEGVNPDLLKT